MPSSRDLQVLQRTLNRLSASADRDLRAWLAGVDLAGGPALRATLGPTWVDLVASKGEAAAALGAALFEKWADELELDPVTRVVRPVDEERALARLGWALSTINPQGNLRILLDELVKQPARSTIASSAHASDAAWARVPLGDTCKWCRMLGSRGAVYRDSSRAGEGRSFHGKCDCQIVLVRDRRDYPPGYDPDALLAAN